MDLVVGATGSLGGRIARSLLERGERVRILARSNSNYADLEREGAEVVTGDLKDPRSLERAVAGVSRVLTTANSASRGGEDNVETVDRQGTANLVEAARQAEVERFVYVSTSAADLDSPVPFFRAKAESEQKIVRSGLNYTILQPVLFMEVWIGAFLRAQLAQGPKVQLIGDGRKKVAFVSEADVAKLAVNVVDHPEASNVCIVISGAATGYRDLVRAVERITGTPIEIETLEPGANIDRLPEPMRETMSGLMSGLARGPETDFTTPEVAKTYGFELTPLETFLSATFEASVAAD